MLKFNYYFMWILAIISILYYFAVRMISGAKTSFLWFWIVTFFSSVLLALLIKLGMNPKYPFFHKLSVVFTTCFWGFFLLFLLFESILIYHGQKQPINDADYAIILGAQVRGRVPSKTLQARIDAATDYLNHNPNTIAICSGGQGNGELLSEAAVIKDGLIKSGIDSNRILMEDSSTNTVENLIYSTRLFNNANSSMVIITSNFHCYRAGKIAKKIGFKNVYTYSAKEWFVTTPQYYIREFFANVKELLIGNINI